VTVRVPVYDSGMLIGLTNHKAKAEHLHARFRESSHRPVVPGAVLAQVWRPKRGTVHTLARALKDCTIPQARSSAPAMRRTGPGQPACMLCATPPDVADWQRIGTVLGTAEIPPKKRPDAVDTLVALTAVRHHSAVVFTSDPEDLTAYLTALGAQDVHVVPV
jgi:hypothetical protein